MRKDFGRFFTWSFARLSRRWYPRILWITFYHIISIENLPITVRQVEWAGAQHTFSIYCFGLKIVYNYGHRRELGEFSALFSRKMWTLEQECSKEDQSVLSLELVLLLANTAITATSLPSIWHFLLSVSTKLGYIHPFFPRCTGQLTEKESCKGKLNNEKNCS